MRKHNMQAYQHMGNGAGGSSVRHSLWHVHTTASCPSNCTMPHPHPHLPTLTPQVLPGDSALLVSDLNNVAIRRVCPTVLHKLLCIRNEALQHT
jgi:hypothetical protein